MYFQNHRLPTTNSRSAQTKTNKILFAISLTFCLRFDHSNQSRECLYFYFLPSWLPFCIFSITSELWDIFDSSGSQSVFPSFRSQCALSQIPWWSPTCLATYWGCPAPSPTPPCTVTSTTISTKRSWWQSGRSRTPSTLASRWTLLPTDISTSYLFSYFNLLKLRSLNSVNLLYRLYYILIYTFLQMRTRNCNLESTEETGFWSENTFIWKL